jgi:hypothetical protein
MRSQQHVALLGCCFTEQCGAHDRLRKYKSNLGLLMKLNKNHWRLHHDASVWLALPFHGPGNSRKSNCPSNMGQCTFCGICSRQPSGFVVPVLQRYLLASTGPVAGPCPALRDHTAQMICQPQTLKPGHVSHVAWASPPAGKNASYQAVQLAQLHLLATVSGLLRQCSRL